MSKGEYQFRKVSSCDEIIYDWTICGKVKIQDLGAMLLQGIISGLNW